ncbi:mechanosensitive ion channel family protein [Aliamphritea hakodatensis]|uniref:mechanosensitive ion channel family protein n=1 Tax=Aliamphritea hakodatensis TaxID=2895352 RepID=UPI0022FD53AB|nr:mechanosensitive ion channel family protein [Aliamphritea hakodatensis]
MLKTWSLIFALLLSVSTTAFAADSSGDDEFLYSSEKMASFLFMQHAIDRKDQLIRSLNNWSEQTVTMWHNMTKGQGADGFTELLLTFTAMMIIALFIEALVGYKLKRLCDRITEQNSLDWRQSLGLLLLRCVFSYIALAVFSVVAYLIPLTLYDTEDIYRVSLVAILNMVISIRAFAIIAQLIWAPHASGLRLMNIECHLARRFYFWSVGFIAVYNISTTSWQLLYQFGIDAIMFALIVPVNGLLMNSIAIMFIVLNRKPITNLFTDGREASTLFTQNVRQMWPTIITIWLLVIWAIWAANEFLGYYSQADQITPAWWITISFPILDRIIFVLLNKLKDITWLQSHSFERRCDTFIKRTLIAIRTILISAVLYHVINSFGYDTWEMLAASLGNMIDKSVDVIIVLVIAYAVWEVIQSAIERHLPADAFVEDNGMASLEGEGGGAGATRSETLLPLVRSFLLVFLLVCVILTVLSIAGVEIAPLLAGAGIVGIAVGFGAQKLVQDVISGIFFLLDDAFRRGEYIEAAGLRGTVERISIRSIRLRHHLGAVQTIPFSEMATVTNLSRDWITMKLEFRLAYDTNVEQVRKLIKKVGQKMLEHEEYGPHFLLPLKSQGVIRVEESALIFRMKFTCVPGEQWIIRREAYRLVKEALSANDIHFAHRSVHVLLPDQPDELDKSTDAAALQQQTIAKAGAAALTASPEIRRQDKIDDDKANVIGADADSS